MSTAWKEKTLSSVLKLEYGKPLEKDYRKSDGLYPAYGANGEKARTDKYYHDKPSIIVGRKGSAGEINLTAEKFWPLDVTYFVTFDEKNYNLRFLFHLLTSLNLPSLAKGVKPGINRNDVYSKRVKIPPIEEQKRIVSILDESFEAIDIVKANTEKNLQNARALFESYLDEIFSKPKRGWNLRKFSDFCSITSKLVDPRKPENLDLIHVGAANIESKTGNLIELKTAKEEALISGKFQFDESMVLYSKIRPYLMKVARPDFNGLCSADIYPLAPFINLITRNFLFYLLTCNYFTNYAVQGSARAGMPKVNRDHLFNFSLYLPPLNTQKILEKKLDNLHHKICHLESTYQKKLVALEELKKSLLHQAFNGGL